MGHFLVSPAISNDNRKAKYFNVWIIQEHQCRAQVGERIGRPRKVVIDDDQFGFICPGEGKRACDKIDEQLDDL